MILIIDTSKFEKIQLALFLNRKLYQTKAHVVFNESEKILPLIGQLLNRTKTKVNNLKAIFVVTGPGPFTSLRVGITIANTLGWIFKIPAIGIKNTPDMNIKRLIRSGMNKFNRTKGFKAVLPFYGKAPNITRSKKPW